ncbi:MAG: phytoene synthase [Flavobacteriaceae bacterium]|nr:phytoene synthase [Flavobacteriaceae bacterium]
MKKIFDSISEDLSKVVTEKYSTSFSIATKLIDNSIRQDIYNVYGFVRIADEIVDSFHQYPKKEILDSLEEDVYIAINRKISINPILNSFQKTVNKYKIDIKLIEAFLRSMRWDLNKKSYSNKNDYEEYIYGSADSVGLMCLKIFVKGDDILYKDLKKYAMALGSAFQKVNFLRDINTDFETLNRTYFPGVDVNKFDEKSKKNIIEEIEDDFNIALKGIVLLPNEARFGVYTAYKYYMKLLEKLKKTPSLKIKEARIRVPNYQKAYILINCYLKYNLNLL